MFARFALTTMTLAVIAMGLSGCVGDRRAADRPGAIAADREAQAGRGDYRDHRQAHRDQFCVQYPGDPACFGRRDRPAGISAEAPQG